jgi:DNA-directed RNA polymerase I, II, and III subunit RPABC1
LVSDDEIHMDLQRFRELYANNSGVVECVIRIFLSMALVLILRSRNQLNFYTTSRSNPADQIFVFFSEERSVGVKTMRK